MDQWCESAIYFTFSLAIILKVGLFNNIGELSNILGLFKNIRDVIKCVFKIKAIYIRIYSYTRV